MASGGICVRHHTNDCKHMGYGYIPQGRRRTFDAFYQGHFNRYLNFHRPVDAPVQRAVVA